MKVDKILVFAIFFLFVGISVAKPIVNTHQNIIYESSQDEQKIYSSKDGFGNTYVDDDFDSSTGGWKIDHFDNIQDGINALSEGGTVHIYNGNYGAIDGIDVLFPLHLKGETKEKTIVFSNNISSVIKIKSSYVTITNLTIKWSPRNAEKIAGIRLFTESDTIKNVTIQNNNIMNNSIGIYSGKASNLKIVDNNILGNDIYGIQISGDNHEIHHNEIFKNPTGVYTTNIRSSRIWENTIYDNKNGIILEESDDNDFYDNTFNKNIDGIILQNANDNDLWFNQIYDNIGNGTILKNSDYNILTNNTIKDNDKNGILLDASSFNHIKNNTIEENGKENWTEPIFGLQSFKTGIQFTSKDKQKPCTYNEVYNNTIQTNIGGIIIFNSHNNKFYENDIIKNKYYGFRISYKGRPSCPLEISAKLIESTNNEIYHNNFIENGKYVNIIFEEPIGYANAVDPNCFQNEPLNRWDNGEADRTNTNYSKGGGNYWSDYEDKYGFPGFNHTTGIWNEAYKTCMQYDTMVNEIRSLLKWTLIAPFLWAYFELFMFTYPITLQDRPLNSDNHPWYRMDGWRNQTQVSPIVPTITGPKTGKISQTLTYTVNSTDEDRDKISYLVNWGDTTTGPYGPYDSGIPTNIYNEWATAQTYNVTVKAIDTYGLESEWSVPYTVEIHD